MLSHGLRKLLNAFDRTRTTRVRHGRYQWCLSPAGSAFFDAPPDLDGWIRDGLAQVIKQGTQRTVYRVELPQGVVFAKRCRVNGLRTWWREMLRPAKAQLEFENALMLHDLGVPVVEPLAWACLARPGPGESIFITRCQDGAVPLQAILDGRFPNAAVADKAQRRRETARTLGELLARLHDAGVAHPDPHPGNLLAVERDSAAPAVTFIDLHAIRFGSPLTWNESVANLVLFNRWFQLRASRSDRLRFWHAYVEARTTLPKVYPATIAKLARRVERLTMHSNARFWVNRFARYTKCSRHVHCLSRRGIRGYAVPELPSKFVERLVADPESPFLEATAVLKDSPSSSVIEITIPGGHTAIYKKFTLRSPLSALKNFFRPSAAQRSWLYGHNLLDRGLPTARPLLMIERTRFGLRSDGYLLTEKVDDAEPLHEAANACDSWRSVRTAAVNVGQLLSKLHHKRVAHRDLKASNILLTSSLEPVLIDLVGVTPGSQPLPKALRIRDVSRLAASFRDSRKVTRSDKLRALRAYLVAGLHGPQHWKRWWRAIDAAIQRKQAKNARRGRPLA